ncbi:serine/threonine protein kinase [Verrucomicrobiaceae bacterium SCGC AG-212-N21]|nr:serine/threonine protein kinase [Verrucomicrobiaceae bacterium SCGC AG-212-N21]
MPSLAILGTALTLSAAPASAANWPSWRGPTHDGVTEEANLPTKWSAKENVKWKVSLPERGNSTPVVWGDKVFLTQNIGDKRGMICFDKKSGKQLWDFGTTWTKSELSHGTNPFCSASPATDGERVITFYGSAGLFCHDMNGKELWKRTDLGDLHHIWGYGSSPVIEGDRVFLNFGPGENTTLFCFDKKTGKTLWKHEEPGGASGEGSNKKWLGYWGDPVLKKIGNHDELFMVYPNRACAFDPATGKELWTCAGPSLLTYNTPLVDNGIMYILSSYGGSGVAVKAGGKGDVTSSQRVWHLPKVQQRIGSPVIYEGHYYILLDGGIAECRDLKTGEVVYSERLKGPGPTGQNWSSVVRSGDKLYAVNQGGDAFIWKASPKFELLATNSLGEKVIGSIAVSDGLLFIRSHQNLWCIGK